MRHRKAGRQFGRSTSHRRAMFRALAANLLAHERIETTDAKAKELRRVTERLITRARRLGSIAYTPQAELSQADQARRQAAQQRVGRFLRRFATIEDGDGVRRIDLVEKVFVDLAKRYRERRGGYTRIIKAGRRRGDNAPLSIIELVDSEVAASAAALKKGAEVKRRAGAEEEAVEGEAVEQAAPAAKAAKPAKAAKSTEAAKPEEPEEAVEAEEAKPAKAVKAKKAAKKPAKEAKPAKKPAKKAAKKPAKKAAKKAAKKPAKKAAKKPAKSTKKTKKSTKK